MAQSFSSFRHASKAAGVFFIIVTNAASAQNNAPTEDILITGSRFAGGVRTDLLGASYSILDSRALEERQIVVVSDILRDVPGVAVNRGGTVGSSTQIRLRGGEANHTLVMIDGIEASDPFAGEFDFASLIADDAAKIEVLRGQQSALYGSNAIGGVIQYITATGAEAPGVRARLEGGSFDTVSGFLRVAGVSGALDYAVNGALSRTGGAIGARNGIRHDSAENESVAGKLIYRLADNLHLTAVGRYSHLDAETTPQDFDFPPGPNYGLSYDRLPSNSAVQVGDSTAAESFYGLLQGNWALMDGRWTHQLSVQGVSSDRQNFDDTGVLTSDNVGTREKASYVTTFSFGDAMAMHAATFAADFKHETYQNKPIGAPPLPLNAKQKLDNVGFVGQYDLRIGEAIGFGAAIRHDNNDHFEDATTYRVQGSYRPLADLRVRAAFGTGITNPTNRELFGFDPTTFIGNPNLKPERSEGWEAGVDYSLLGSVLNLGATYFDNRLKDEIVTVFTPAFLTTVQNRTTESTEQGVELWLSARFGEQWRVDAAWTNLHALEGAPAVQEVRRPPNIASLNVAWRAMNDRYGANLTLRYNGEQRDLQFTPLGASHVPMPSYTLVNLGGDYRIDDTWQLYGRVENLLDTTYEEVFAFPAPGIGAYLGIRARLQ